MEPTWVESINRYSELSFDKALLNIRTRHKQHGLFNKTRTKLKAYKEVM